MTAYTTTEQATAYLAQRLNSEAWTSATPAKQAAALSTAETLLDSLPFKGRIASLSQAQAWPRTGVFDSEGRAIPSTAIPSQIAAACAEWALYLLANPEPSKPTAPLRRKRVGDLELEYAVSPSIADNVPPMVRALLTPLLITGPYTARVIPA